MNPIQKAFLLKRRIAADMEELARIKRTLREGQVTTYTVREAEVKAHYRRGYTARRLVG